MTYSEASTRLKEYCGHDDLLRAMERVQDQLKEGVHMDASVRAAYFTLMAGFTEMMG